MMELQNVSVKKGNKIILLDCNQEIANRAFIIGKNNSGKTVLLNTLRGKNKVLNGEIHINEDFIRGSEINFSKSIFFFISERHHYVWKDLKIGLIDTLYTKKPFQDTPITRFYNIQPNMQMKDMNNLQKLVFFTHIGLKLKRLIFLFDEPLKYLDYEERQGFYVFIDRFLKDNALIITSNNDDNQLRRTLKKTYYLDSEQLNLQISLKGGENYAH